MRRLLNTMVALTLVALGAPAVTARAAETVDGPRVHWNYSGWGKPRASSRIYENFAKYMDERTGGRFTVGLNWGTLSTPPALPITRTRAIAPMSWEPGSPAGSTSVRLRVA
ncbi:MAG: hypothetical protein KDC18_06375 [Alphaproteobacteria bacterium]|nr:hypothetical protein [Alphaproteobacteria bacterium]MCB9931621.1 hypothetical protein [Alphaproteobacteria bacterium]